MNSGISGQFGWSVFGIFVHLGKSTGKVFWLIENSFGITEKNLWIVVVILCPTGNNFCVVGKHYCTRKLNFCITEKHFWIVAIIRWTPGNILCIAENHFCILYVGQFLYYASYEGKLINSWEHRTTANHSTTTGDICCSMEKHFCITRKSHGLLWSSVEGTTSALSITALLLPGKILECGKYPLYYRDQLLCYGEQILRYAEHILHCG